MAVAASRPSVTTSATAIYTNSETGSDLHSVRVLLKNVTATVSVYLGPAGVTTSNGFEWAVADGPVEVELEPGESLYGIVAVTTQTVHALKQGR